MVVQEVIMTYVLVRTYMKSKLPYLYTCAILMLLSPVFYQLEIILYNWGFYCQYFYYDNEKCHGQASPEWVANVKLFTHISAAINCASFSCPVLASEPYEADQLEVLLDDATKNFLEDEQRGLKFVKRKTYFGFGDEVEDVYVSKIFNCGYNKGTSVLEVAKEFKKQTSKRVAIISAEKRQFYQLNAYRVLLTRARQGMVIFIPEGDLEDPTRPPIFYDPIWEFFKACGLTEVKL